LVKDTIDSAKYKALQSKEERISYLRALAIGSLINDAVRVFLEHETAILQGEFHTSLLHKSKYKAQMEDIINISVKNIYQCPDVIEKEVMGYTIINSLLDAFCKAYINYTHQNASHYDGLILKLLPEKFMTEKNTTYEKLLHICHFVSLLTDGKALQLFNKIKGM